MLPSNTRTLSLVMNCWLYVVLAESNKEEQYKLQRVKRQESSTVECMESETDAIVETGKTGFNVTLEHQAFKNAKPHHLMLGSGRKVKFCKHGKVELTIDCDGMNGRLGVISLTVMDYEGTVELEMANKDGESKQTDSFDVSDTAPTAVSFGEYNQDDVYTVTLSFEHATKGCFKVSDLFAHGCCGQETTETTLTPTSVPGNCKEAEREVITKDGGFSLELQNPIPKSAKANNILLGSRKKVKFCKTGEIDLTFNCGGKPGSFGSLELTTTGYDGSVKLKMLSRTGLTKSTDSFAVDSSPAAISFGPYDQDDVFTINLSFDHATGGCFKVSELSAQGCCEQEPCTNSNGWFSIRLTNQGKCGKAKCSCKAILKGGEKFMKNVCERDVNGSFRACCKFCKQLGILKPKQKRKKN